MTEPRTVLVVDDQELVRSMVEDTLEMHGFSVLVAGSAEEALQIVGEHEGRLDVLLCDVVMSGVGGFELGRRLETERPGLEVLFFSGYPAEVLRSRGLPEGAVLIPKPFKPSQLLAAVQEACDRRQT